jgi:hypothetical protein
MSTVKEPPPQHDDSNELAQFGYKQELDRSLGSFSSFAAGFSYISILTGVFQLFGLAFLSAGPGVLAGRGRSSSSASSSSRCASPSSPGSSRSPDRSTSGRSRSPARSRRGWRGWLLLVGSIVTVAAVAVAYQVILPQVTTSLQFVGSAADAGLTNTPGGAQNAVILAIGLVAFTTIINMIGVKLMARINNVGVAAELVGVTLLIILLALHITRGPDVVFETNGTGAGHDWGYFGAWLLGSIVSVYVMYGFDTAGSLAEETNNPRKHAPPAILRALAAAGLAGGLLIIVAMMSVSSITAKEIGTLGPALRRQGRARRDARRHLPARLRPRDHRVCARRAHRRHPHDVLDGARQPPAARLGGGPGLGQVQDADRAGARDRRAHGGAAAHQHRQPARVLRARLGRDHPVLPRLPVRDRADAARAAARRLAADEPRPVLLARPLGPRRERRGGRYGTIAIINLAWPREEIYGADHWYFQYGAFVFVGILAIVGGLYYLLVQRDKPAEPLPEHRAEIEAALASTS